MSVFEDWPGAGDVPEPEAEGFREEQVQAERERQVQQKADELEASKQKKEELSGKPADSATPAAKGSKPRTDDAGKAQDAKGSKGTTSH